MPSSKHTSKAPEIEGRAADSVIVNPDTGRPLPPDMTLEAYYELKNLIKPAKALSPLESFIQRRQMVETKQVIGQTIAPFHARGCPDHKTFYGERRNFMMLLDLGDILVTKLTFQIETAVMGGFTESVHEGPPPTIDGQTEFFNNDISAIVNLIQVDSQDSIIVTSRTWFDGQLNIFSDNELDHQLPFANSDFPSLLLQGQRLIVRGTAPIGCAVVVAAHGYSFDKSEI